MATLSNPDAFITRRGVKTFHTDAGLVELLTDCGKLDLGELIRVGRARHAVRRGLEHCGRCAAAITDAVDELIAAGIELPDADDV